MADFQDQVIIITDAADGIGRTTASHFANAGTITLMAAISESAGENVVEKR